MLVTLNEVLKDAKRNKYAVGLFNTVNLEMAVGVLAAAEELCSPVIIGSAECLLCYSGLEDLANMLLPMAKRASVPVVLHFDHGLTEENVKKAIALGFSSVMYDCSTLGFEENLSAVKAICDYSHSKGITVEAEIGHVGTEEVSVPSDAYTDPDEAKSFAEFTGCDALAIAVGTSHGAYKFKPRLDFERIEKIASMIEAPLVLHGGSGLSDDDFRRAIAAGISKINIFTDLNVACLKAAHDSYAEGKGMTEVMGAMSGAVKEATMKKMLLFGSNGRA